MIEVSDTMPGPPEVVWALITDWEHQDDWMLEASDFEVIGDQREGVGVEAKATVRIGGIKTRDTVRVSMWEPPRILVIDHLGWVQGSGEIQLQPVSEGTRMRWKETLFPPRQARPLRPDRPSGRRSADAPDLPARPAGAARARPLPVDGNELKPQSSGAGRAR